MTFWLSLYFAFCFASACFFVWITDIRERERGRHEGSNALAVIIWCPLIGPILFLLAIGEYFWPEP